MRLFPYVLCPNDQLSSLYRSPLYLRDPFWSNMDGSGNRGFLYDGRVFRTIGIPNALATEARGLSDRGQVVGRYLDSSGVSHGFLATPSVTPFATFTALLQVKLAPRIDNAFVLQSIFTLDTGSNGLDLAQDDVTLASQLAPSPRTRRGASHARGTAAAWIGTRS
jgi:hypothetical protein